MQATNTRSRFEVVADGQSIYSHVGAALLGELADRLGLTGELGRRANRGMRAGAYDRGPGAAQPHTNGSPTAHHRQARFTWGLGPAGAEPAIVGFDVAVAAEDGRLRSVLGFLDKVPA